MTSPHQASHVVRPTAPKQPTRRRPKQEPFQFGQVLQPKDDLIGGYIVEHDRKQIRIDKNTFERIEQLAGPQRHMLWKMGQWVHCVEEFLRVRSTRFGWRAERRAPYGRWGRWQELCFTMVEAPVLFPTAEAAMAAAELFFPDQPDDFWELSWFNKN